MKHIFKSDVPNAMYNPLRSHLSIDVGGWFEQGVDCEVLRIGAKGWRKGKLKVKVIVEFCPDEPEISQPESPLEEIRRTIK